MVASQSLTLVTYVLQSDILVTGHEKLSHYFYCFLTI